VRDNTACSSGDTTSTTSTGTTSNGDLIKYSTSTGTSTSTGALYNSASACTVAVVAHLHSFFYIETFLYL
jgi:hypothetical protein